ncbi:hypothetical protein KAR48_14290 [bacterium]|nr:hypothetical protein [bacterium]
MRTNRCRFAFVILPALALWAATTPPSGNVIESHESDASSSYIGQSTEKHYKQAQQFYLDGEGVSTITGVGILLRSSDHGNPVDDITIAVYTNGSGNVPLDLVAGTEKSFSPVLGQWNYVDFESVSLARGSGNKYWIMASIPEQTANNAYCWCRSSSNTYAKGYHKQERSDTPGEWTTVSNDLSFKVYADQSLAVSGLSHSISVNKICVRLKWETQAELDCLGFNIWRSECPDKNFIKITPDMIRAEGCSSFGGEYSYDDETLERSGIYYYRVTEVNPQGESIIIGPLMINAVFESGAPVSIKLNGAYPNPFNPATIISLRAGDSDVGKLVQMTVHNIRGQVVYSSEDLVIHAKVHEIAWPGCDDAGMPVSGGVYFCSLRSGSEIFGTIKVLKVN